MFENKDDANSQRPPNKISNRRKTKPTLMIVTLALGLVIALAASQSFSTIAQKTYAATTGTAPSAPTANKTTSAPTYFHGSPWPPTSTISTTGSSSTKVNPDRFSVTVGVITNGTTAAEAASKNSDLMTSVISALKALGISPGDITTNNYSVSPNYSYDSPKFCPQSYGAPYCPPSQVVTGYTASNSVTVTLDTAGAIDAGKVIDTSVQAGANNVYGVDFFVSQAKQQSIRDSLTQEAIANARHRADIAAGALGMAVSGVQSVNLNDVYFPIYSARVDHAAGLAATPTPIQAGQQDITTNVSVVFYFSDPSAGGMNQTGSAGPTGMMRSLNNPDCVNPPGGPMIC
ncbi:MAG: SIMPL domain-containing protein [Nitrososphaera sp.]|jgi:uncharacterized protein YggE